MSYLSKSFIPIVLGLITFGVFVFVKPSQPAYAAGNTYYVDSAIGNGANNGTSPATPWTLAEVNASMPGPSGNGHTIHAGDTILFNKGQTFTGQLYVKTTGTAGNILTFGAYGSGANPIINAAGINHGIDLRTMNYITVQDIDVINAVADGFLVFNGGSNLTISRCKATNSLKGIVINTGTFSNIIISDGQFTGQSRGISMEALAALTNLTVNGGVYDDNSSYGIFLQPAVTITNVTLQNFTANDTTAGPGIFATRIDQFVISQVTCTNNKLQGLNLAGISNATISDLTSTGNTQDGILISHTGAVNAINVTVSDSNFSGNTPGVTGFNGLSLSGNGSNFTATDVIASNNGGDGFNVHNTWTDVTFDRCVAETNGINGLGSDGDGFSFHETTSGTIINSISKNNKKSAIAHINSANVTMNNNLFSHTTNGTIALVYLGDGAGPGTYKLQNNVIYSGGATGTMLRYNNVTANIQNNIIVGGDVGILAGGAATLTENHNLVFGAATNNFSGLVPDVTDIQLNPKLVNPPTDFSLQADSPAIDAGVDLNINTDYAGNARYDMPGVPNTGSVGAFTKNYVDIGAYEYVTAPGFNISTPYDYTWTNDSTPTFHWVPAGDGSGIATFKLYIDGIYKKSYSGNVTSGTFKVPISQGTHHWYVTAIDNSANITQSANTKHIRIDTRSPYLSVISPNSTNWFTTGEYMRVKGMATDNRSGIKSLIIHNHANEKTYTAKVTGGWFARWIQLKPGANYVLVQAKDKAGNRTKFHFTAYRTASWALRYIGY